MRYDGMIGSLLMGFARKLTAKQKQTEQVRLVATAIAKRLKGKWLYSAIVILVRYPTTVTGFIRTIAMEMSMKMRHSSTLELEKVRVGMANSHHASDGSDGDIFIV